MLEIVLTKKAPNNVRSFCTQGGSEASELNPLLIIYFDKYHLK
jgi:hypothetical protein